MKLAWLPTIPLNLLPWLNPCIFFNLKFIITSSLLMNSFIQCKFLNIVYGAAQKLIAIPALEVLYSVTFASYCRKDGKSCCSEKQPTNQIRTSA